MIDLLKRMVAFKKGELSPSQIEELAQSLMVEVMILHAALCDIADPPKDYRRKSSELRKAARQAVSACENRRHFCHEPPSEPVAQEVVR